MVALAEKGTPFTRFKKIVREFYEAYVPTQEQLRNDAMTGWALRQRSADHLIFTRDHYNQIWKKEKPIQK